MALLLFIEAFARYTRFRHVGTEMDRKMFPRREGRRSITKVPWKIWTNRKAAGMVRNIIRFVSRCKYEYHDEKISDNKKHMVIQC